MTSHPLNQDEFETARSLVLEHGWNSTCYQVLNPGVERWLNSDQAGLVGYVRSGKMLIVAGAPICALENLASVLTEFEMFAHQRNLGVCYFGAESRLRDQIAGDAGYVQVVLGYQPDWHPSTFLERIRDTASLRAQVHRAENHGVTVSEWPRERAEDSPELWAVLDHWLANKGLPMLHFLVEPETLRDLSDRRIFVAEQDHSVVGFVTLCPIPHRNGWLTEQFVRLPSASNGTIELTLFRAVEAIEKSKAEYVTMGIVPLIDRGEHPEIVDPSWLSELRRIACSHLGRFYSFRGLDEFKTKFRSETWQPVVVIVKDRKFRFRHLKAIARAFTKIPPEIALVIGLVRILKRKARDHR